jgi:hypothetical protein
LECSAARQAEVFTGFVSTFPHEFYVKGSPTRLLKPLLNGQPVTSAGLLALLLTGQPAAAGDDATVVARYPLPPRLSAFAAASPAGVPADVVTLGDLRRAISDVLAGPLGSELTRRVNEYSLA